MAENSAELSFTEEGIIDRLRKDASAFFNPGCLQGIGDDCAVLETSGQEAWLVTTDALVEDIHFKRDWISPEDLAFKLLSVNVSDIAAMGGKPLWGLLNLALPRTLSRNWVDAFLDGIKTATNFYELDLIGGDTVASLGAIMLSATVIGKAQTTKIKRRACGKQGDLVFITGFLGDSGLGLAHILGQKKLEAPQYFLSKHNRPSAHWLYGQQLGQESSVHAMMDLSDGLSTDLARLCLASGCSARVDLEKLPLSKELQAEFADSLTDAQEHAAISGEDYVLLFSADVAFLSTALYRALREANACFCIGKLIEGNAGVCYFRNDEPAQLKGSGYKHFS